MNECLLNGCNYRLLLRSGDHSIFRYFKTVVRMYIHKD